MIQINSYLCVAQLTKPWYNQQCTYCSKFCYKKNPKERQTVLALLDITSPWNMWSSHAWAMQGALFAHVLETNTRQHQLKVKWKLWIQGGPLGLQDSMTCITVWLGMVFYCLGQIWLLDWTSFPIFDHHSCSGGQGVASKQAERGIENTSGCMYAHDKN